MTSKSRWMVLVLLFLMVTVAYLARMNISVALPFIADEYLWTGAQKGRIGGILLSAFLLGYGISNILFSSAGDIFGTKRTLLIAILSWSVSTSLGVVFGQVYHIFIASRVLVGLGQGILYPAAIKFIQNWFHSRERSRANASFLIGGDFANILAPLMLVPIIIATSWRIMFHLVALLGFLLAIPVWLYLKDSPSSSGNINKKIKVSKEFKNVLKKWEFWILVISYGFMVIGWWGITSWLPTYLLEAQNFSIKEMALGAAVPYVGGLIGALIGSWISDKTGKRIIITISSFLIVAFFFMIMPLIYSKLQISLILISIIFFFSWIAPNIFTLLQSIVPPEVMSTSTGFLNGISNLCGVSGPITIGIIIALTGSYNLGLIFIAIIMCAGAGVLASLWRGNSKVE